MYLVSSAISSFYQLNFALAAHSLTLNDLPIDLVRAIDVSIQSKQPLRYNQSYTDNTTIPRIIHRTYKSLTIPPQWWRAYSTCVDKNPGYTQYFWTDDTAREFIKTQFPWFLHTYDSYPFAIQRVDALRYFLLWTYGGVYLDLDISCRRSLDPLLRPAAAFFPRTWPYGVSNDIMASTPGHPLIVKAALSLHDNANNGKFRISKYITVLFTTGPMFLNQILTSWFRAVKRSPALSAPSSSVAILPPIFYDRTAYAFFGHLPGSSWHGGDAKFVRWICRHLAGLSVLGFGVMVFVAAGAWGRSRRRRVEQSRAMDVPMTYYRDTSV